MKLKPDQEAQAKTLLQGLPLFAGCQEAQLAALVPALDAREMAAGKVVLMDQEIGKTLYILAKGKVGVWKRVGGEKKLLATLEAPNFVGERSMFEESPASALVKAEEPCQILALERPQFDAIAAQFPELPAIIRKNMEAVRAQRMGPEPKKPESGESAA